MEEKKTATRKEKKKNRIIYIGSSLITLIIWISLTTRHGFLISPCIIDYPSFSHDNRIIPSITHKLVSATRQQVPLHSAPNPPPLHRPANLTGIVAVEQMFGGKGAGGRWWGGGGEREIVDLSTNCRSSGFAPGKTHSVLLAYPLACNGSIFGHTMLGGIRDQG